MKRLAFYHLETLIWIARLGTFAAAASRLNTTQPAITARVREIEHQLRTPVFRRQGRRMVLTVRGRQLVRDCEPLWAAIEQTLLNDGDLSQAPGVIRIGAGEIAASTCLPGILADVEQSLPRIAMEIEIDLTAPLLEAVLAGRADLVFLAGPVTHPGITTRPVGGVELVWLGRPGCEPDLACVWSLPPSSPLHHVARKTLRTAGLRPTLHTCDNVRMLIDMILLGEGMALLPEPMVRPLLASGMLVEVLPQPSEVIRFEAAVRVDEVDAVVLAVFERISVSATGLDLASDAVFARATNSQTTDQNNGRDGIG